MSQFALRRWPLRTLATGAKGPIGKVLMDMAETFMDVSPEAGWQEKEDSRTMANIYLTEANKYTSSPDKKFLLGIASEIGASDRIGNASGNAAQKVASEMGGNFSGSKSDLLLTFSEKLIPLVHSVDLNEINRIILKKNDNFPSDKLAKTGLANIRGASESYYAKRAGDVFLLSLEENSSDENTRMVAHCLRESTSSKGYNIHDNYHTDSDGYTAVVQSMALNAVSKGLSGSKAKILLDMAGKCLDKEAIGEEALKQKESWIKITGETLNKLNSSEFKYLNRMPVNKLSEKSFIQYLREAGINKKENVDLVFKHAMKGAGDMDSINTYHDARLVARGYLNEAKKHIPAGEKRAHLLLDVASKIDGISYIDNKTVCGAQKAAVDMILKGGGFGADPGETLMDYSRELAKTSSSQDLASVNKVITSFIN